MILNYIPLDKNLNKYIQHICQHFPDNHLYSFDHMWLHNKVMFRVEWRELTPDKYTVRATYLQYKKVVHPVYGEPPYYDVSREAVEHLRQFYFELPKQ